MDLIWNIISVYGLVSMTVLALGIWAHLEMRKMQREKKSGNDKPEKKT